MIEAWRSGLVWLATTLALSACGGSGPAQEQNVTVSPPPPVTLTVMPDGTTANPSAVVQFTATVTGPADTSVIWSADGGTIQQNGAWTAPQSAGTFHVTARSVADPSKTAVAAITVTPPARIRISISPDSLTAGAGGPPIQFAAHVTGTADTAVDWSIPAPVASNRIDANGLFTPGPDSAFFQVVATSRADPSVKATAGVMLQPLLLDGGGAIVPSARTFALWWGDPAAFAPDVRPAVEAFLRGLDGSSFLAVLDQYMRGAKATTTFGGSLFDSSAPPQAGDGVAIGNAVCRNADANGIQLRDGDVFLVNTSNFPAGSSICAGHSWFTCHGQTVLFAYIPNPSGQLCGNAQDLCGTGLSSTALAMVAASSHELIETVTDPLLSNGWMFNGQEAVDLCGITSCVTLTNGAIQLGSVYSDSALTCVTR